MVEKFETVKTDFIASGVVANNHSIPNSRGSGGISNTDREGKSGAHFEIKRL